MPEITIILKSWRTLSKLGCGIQPHTLKIFPHLLPRLYCTVVISVGLQVGILHSTLEGEIKCPIYIVVMTVALPYGDGTDPAFVCKPVFVDPGCPLRKWRWDGANGADHHH